MDGLLGLVDHLDATQHVITNALVDDIDDAGIKARSNLIAPHLLASVVKRYASSPDPGREWFAGGHTASVEGANATLARGERRGRW